MSTQTTVDERLSPTGGGDDDDLDHIYCCDENRALCGTDVTNAPECDWLLSESPCVVCADLDRLPCERCGFES